LSIALTKEHPTSTIVDHQAGIVKSSLDFAIEGSGNSIEVFNIA
jgi:hypothetical protein